MLHLCKNIFLALVGPSPQNQDNNYYTGKETPLPLPVFCAFRGYSLMINRFSVLRKYVLRKRTILPHSKKRHLQTNNLHVAVKNGENYLAKNKKVI